MNESMRLWMRLGVGGLIAGMVVMADKLNTAAPKSATEWIIVCLLAGVAVANNIQAGMSQPPRLTGQPPWPRREVHRG